MYSKNTYSNIDITKLLCAIMVVIIHCKPLLPYSYTANVLTAEGICRIAVPFFFMASGFLLQNKLNHTSSHDVVFIKYFKRIGKLYLIWSFIYWGVQLIFWIKDGAFSTNFIFDQVRLFLCEGSYYHFWYLLSTLYALPIVYLLYKRKKRLRNLFVLFYGVVVVYNFHTVGCLDMIHQ